MKKLRSVLLILAACCISMTAFACSTEEEANYKEMDEATRESLSSLAAQDSRLTGELENKTIKWLSDWDINPDANGDKTTPTDLAIFQERYGGEIQWYQCIYSERYDMLANYINASEGIDFFYAGNFDAFPKGAIRSMFVSCDDYIDFDSDLWADVKDMNDAIMWKGQHYMAVVEMTGDNCAVIYNRDTIEELGFDDPAELYAEGKWDWDIFEEMLVAFCDPDNQKYGIDGWWFESGLSATVGVPYIGIEDGQLISNLTDSNIERVQNFMYDLYLENCIAIGVGDFGWSDHPEYIGEGKELFYPAGLYKFYTEANKINEKTGTDSGWRGIFGENCMFVPMPKDPDSDTYYIPANMNSYCFVKDGQNPEGVAKYLDCKRLTLLNEEIKAIGDQQFIDDYEWTQEMIDMKNEMDTLATANPVIDFKNSVTTDLADMLDSSENGVRAASRGTPWNESLAAIQAPVQTMIDEANNS